MRFETATIDPQEFIATVGPSLNIGNIETAIECVRSRWSAHQITELLTYRCPDVRKVAALSLALVGDRHAIQPLAVTLHDSDAMVAEVAEHALWSIWFRMGEPR